MSTVLSRRQFGFVAASLPLAMQAAASSATAADKKPVLVDTHLHCFAGTKDARFPYHERAPYRPEDPATPEQLLQCMDGAGVGYAIVVHPETYQDDHRYLEHCLQVGGKRLKGTLLLFSDRAGSSEQMAELAKRLNVISVRIHAYAPDRLPPFGKPELRSFWRKAADLGLAVQLHFEPRWAPGFEPLIQEFRDTRVIIDHLGRPLQGTPEEHAVVVKWSRFPNTIMKMAAMPTTRTYPHRDIEPIIRELTNAYGSDRMIYGGGFDSSATPQSYRAAFDRARRYLDHLSTADQDKILGDNAVRLFKFHS